MSRLCALASLAFAQTLSGQASHSPGRVVSLGGPVTETVYALGAESRLVGTDESSVFPEAATRLPNVGYFRALGLEGVLSLGPELVLAAEGSGPPVVLEQLETAGVEIVRIPTDYSPEGAARKVRRIARALGMPSEGEALVARMESQLEQVADRLTEVSERPRALFVWGRGGGVMHVSGRETAAQAMMEVVGLQNAITEFSSYRPLTPEAVTAAQPDVIVIDRAMLASLGGVAGLQRDPSLAATPAARAGRIVPVDVLGFIGWGPRTGEVALDVVRAVHGDAETR